MKLSLDRAIWPIVPLPSHVLTQKDCMGLRVNDPGAMSHMRHVMVVPSRWFHQHGNMEIGQPWALPKFTGVWYWGVWERVGDQPPFHQRS